MVEMVLMLRAPHRMDGLVVELVEVEAVDNLLVAWLELVVMVDFLAVAVVVGEGH